MLGQPSSVFRFDPSDLGYIADPYPVYRYLRHSAPVYWWTEGKAWLVSRYDDIALIVADPRFGRLPEELPPAVAAEPATAMAVEIARKTLTGMQPEDHARLRRVLAQSFSPRAVERLTQRVQQITDRLLAEVSGDTIDIVSDIADRLPALLLQSLLGLEEVDEKSIRRFGDLIQFTSAFVGSPVGLDEAFEFALEKLEQFREIVNERRRRPGDDWLSSLIRAEEDGELSPDELLPQMVSLLVAGTETTASFITWAAVELLRHPDQMALIRADPRLLPNALEETMRHQSFGKLSNPLFVRTDMTLRDAHLKRGDAVVPLFGSAQRDPEVFPDPDIFDIRRDLTRSLSFGTGAHRCLGMFLARLEGHVCLGTLLDRFPDMELMAEPQFAPHYLLRRIGSLPVRLRRQISNGA